jgi:hypothetical protein
MSSVFCELEAEVLKTVRYVFYQSSVAEYSGSLDCDAVSLGK